MTSCDRKFSHIVVNTDDDVVKHPSVCIQKNRIAPDDAKRVSLRQEPADDLSIEPMPHIQKLVIGAALLFLAVFAAYYLLILH